MATDYHIYIHDKTSCDNSIKEKTKPNSLTGKVKKTQSKGTQMNVKKGLQMIQNPDSAISGKKLVGLASAAKGGIVGIAIYAAVKITDKVVGTVLPIQATKSGDFRAVNTYNNVKSGISSIFNPVSTGLNLYKQSLQNELQTQRNALNMELLGDAYLTHKAGYKV